MASPSGGRYPIQVQVGGTHHARALNTGELAKQRIQVDPFAAAQVRDAIDPAGEAEGVARVDAPARGDIGIDPHRRVALLETESVPVARAARHRIRPGAAGDIVTGGWAAGTGNGVVAAEAFDVVARGEAKGGQVDGVVAAAAQDKGAPPRRPRRRWAWASPHR